MILNSIPQLDQRHHRILCCSHWFNDWHQDLQAVEVGAVFASFFLLWQKGMRKKIAEKEARKSVKGKMSRKQIRLFENSESIPVELKTP